MYGSLIYGVHILAWETFSFLNKITSYYLLNLFQNWNTTRIFYLSRISIVVSQANLDQISQKLTSTHVAHMP